jgi:hypothetical protein
MMEDFLIPHAEHVILSLSIHIHIKFVFVILLSILHSVYVPKFKWHVNEQFIFTENVPGNIRTAEHFAAFMKRFSIPSYVQESN